MINQPGKKKLFLSLRATLEALRLGLVSDDDLNSGLFQFNYWNRDLLMDPALNGDNPVLERIFKRWEATGVDTLGRVIRALRKAEQEGRVMWAGKDDNSLSRLNELLVRNGYEPTASWGSGSSLHPIVNRLNVVNQDWLTQALEERPKTAQPSPLSSGLPE